MVADPCQVFLADQLLDGFCAGRQDAYAPDVTDEVGGAHYSAEKFLIHGYSNRMLFPECHRIMAFGLQLLARHICPDRSKTSAHPRTSSSEPVECAPELCHTTPVLLGP